MFPITAKYLRVNKIDGFTETRVYLAVSVDGRCMPFGASRRRSGDGAMGEAGTADLARQLGEIRLPDREVFRLSDDGWSRRAAG